MRKAARASKSNDASYVMPRLGELLDSVGQPGRPGALHRLNAQPVDPFLSYRLSQSIGQVEEKLSHYHSTRIKLCQRLGTLNEKSNLFEFGDNQEEFDREIEKLKSMQVKIDVAPVRLKELHNPCPTCGQNMVRLSAHDMYALSWLIVEG
jgi:hypothetical protein